MVLILNFSELRSNLKKMATGQTDVKQSLWFFNN